jgi:NAD(P)-dependent dehydrogenase (short-subunit alcohol dehydrogenase family)
MNMYHADASRLKYRRHRDGISSSAGADTIIAKLPAVDVLVNNVGIFEPKPFVAIYDADWYRFFEVHVMSGVRLA